MGKYGLAWIFASAILTMGANLLFRLGIERGQAGVDTAVSLVNRYLVWFVQPAFLGGIVLYGLAALVWFKVVSSQPLSTAYPILVGMTFLL